MNEELQEIKELGELALEILAMPKEMDALIPTGEWSQLLGVVVATFLNVISWASPELEGETEAFTEGQKHLLLRVVQMSLGLGFALGKNEDAWRRIKDYISIPKIPDVFADAEEG